MVSVSPHVTQHEEPALLVITEPPGSAESGQDGQTQPHSEDETGDAPGYRPRPGLQQRSASPGIPRGPLRCSSSWTAEVHAARVPPGLGSHQECL